MASDTPLLSVFMLTANQEKCVAQVRNSVLLHETDFDSEITTGKGCFTDHTRKTVSRHANEYLGAMGVLTTASNADEIQEEK